MISEESIKELKAPNSRTGSSSISGLPKGVGEFLSKDERHFSSDIVLRFLKTRVTFLQDAHDKDLKALVFAKPPKINFHQFRVGEVIYHTHSFADEIFIIC